MDDKETVKTAETTKTSKPKTTTKEAEKAYESVYTAEYLAANHKALGASYAIVVVALKQAGKETATLEEAKKIVNEFKNKEVK